MNNSEKREIPEILIHSNKTVCESRSFENVVLNDLSPKQIQILMLLASQIGQDDTEFHKYQISMRKLCELFSSNPSDKATINSVEKALEDMRSKTVKFIYHINDANGIEHEIKRITGWIDEVDIVDRKIVYFKMAQWLKIFFLNIPKEQRIIYKVAYLFNLKRKGAINIYRWSYSNSGFTNSVNISIENAKLLFCGDKNKKTANFIRDYVKAGTDEINEKTDLHITYELIKSGGQDKTYTSIKFNIEKRKNSIEIKKETKENILIKEVEKDNNKVPKFDLFI